MYYRVAIWSQGGPQEQVPGWQWKSTVLSSLHALFQFLRLYSALPQDHLRIFSSPSRESLQDQRVQDDSERGSRSAPAAQFLQERMICSLQMRPEMAERQEPQLREMVSSTIFTRTRGQNSSETDQMSSLDRKRIELELGQGGDHDVPYHFAGANEFPQVLAWVLLLARIHRGEVQP